MPGHWTLLASEQSPDGSGATDAWNDPSDASSSTALMVFTKAPQPSSEPYVPDPQAMANLSFTMAETTLKNLLPSPDFTLAPASKTTFGDLDAVASFNAMFVFKGEIGPDKTVVKVSVLMSAGNNGAIIASVTVAPSPSSQYLFATGLIGNYIQGLQLDAQTAYWTGRNEEAGQ
jgi:hypothetical protein